MAALGKLLRTIQKETVSPVFHKNDDYYFLFSPRIEIRGYVRKVPSGLIKKNSATGTF